MKIKFITKILEDIEDLSSVSYTFYKTDYEFSANFTAEVLKKYINNKVNYFNVHDDAFKGMSNVDVVMTYKDNKTKSLSFSNAYDVCWCHNKLKTPEIKVTDQNIRINKRSPLQNTVENKQLVINNVKKMFEDVVAIEDESQRGYKNLLYFTVDGTGYIELLKMCLNSIHAATPQKDFEVLIIADVNSQNTINTTFDLSNFNVHFMTVSKPRDGIDASKNKCRIFEWENINEYNKILYFDCDILCLKDLNVIFERDYQPHKLYTVYNPKIATHVVDSPYHAVTKASDYERLIYNNYNQRPFNAGQFFFINSLKMRHHFTNVIWFMENWPGEYFFEQAFMVEYFCRNILTVCDVIQNDVVIALIPHDKEVKKLHTEDSIAIHFAGPALNHHVKREYIDNYSKAYL
jgi:hypothetical protein